MDQNLMFPNYVYYLVKVRKGIKVASKGLTFIIREREGVSVWNEVLAWHSSNDGWTTDNIDCIEVKFNCVGQKIVNYIMGETFNNPLEWLWPPKLWFTLFFAFFVQLIGQVK